MSEIKGLDGAGAPRLPPRPAAPPAGAPKGPDTGPSPPPASPARAEGDGVAVKRSLTGTLALPEGMDPAKLGAFAKAGLGGASLGLKVEGPTLARHDSGPEVLALQVGLNQVGVQVNGGAIAEDRRFGAQTEAGVAGFQKANQLPADGKADPSTKGALEAANLLLQAEKAMETAGAEQAMVTKHMVDQAQRFLEALPPAVAKPLREQAIKLQEKVEKQKEAPPTQEEQPLQVLEERPPTEEELAAREEAARQQAAADAASTAALQGGQKANTDAQLALQLAEKALAQAEAASALGDTALAQDQAALAEQQAQGAVAAAEAALAELRQSLEGAPDPGALEAKLAKAQALVEQVQAKAHSTLAAAQAAREAAKARNAAFAQAQAQAAVAIQLQQGVADAALAQVQRLVGEFGEQATRLGEAIDASEPEATLQGLLRALEKLSLQAQAGTEAAAKAVERAQAAQASAPEGYALGEGVAKALKAQEAARQAAQALKGMLDSARRQLAEALKTRGRGTSPLPFLGDGEGGGASLAGLPWPLALEALTQAIREGQPEGELVARHAWLQGGLGPGPWATERLAQILAQVGQACQKRGEAPLSVRQLLGQALAMACRLAPQQGQVAAWLSALQTAGPLPPWAGQVAALALQPRQAMQLPRAEGLALAKLLQSGGLSPEEQALRGGMLAQVASRSQEAAPVRQALGWLAKAPEAQQQAALGAILALGPQALRALGPGPLAALADALGPSPGPEQQPQAWQWLKSAVGPGGENKPPA